MHATASLAATVGHWIGTHAFRFMPTDPTDESDAGSQIREIEKRTLTNSKTTASYSAAEAAIRGRYDTRAQSMMQKALDAHEEPKDKARAVIALVKDLGLQPPEAAPLPEIEEWDVNLVAWTALASENL